MSKNILYMIDGYLLKLFPNRKFRFVIYCIVAILVICLLWFALTYINFFNAIWETVENRKIDYILGIAISIVSLFFGIWILDIIKGGTANNIDEFLNLLNIFFEDINNKKNDNIIIITPTLFIGGVNPNHYSERFQENIINLFTYNPNVIVYSEDNIQNFIRNFSEIEDNDDVIVRKSILIEETDDELIKFHKKLFSARTSVAKRKDPKEKVDYFKRLVKFYQKINDFDNKGYIYTAEKLQVILFLNDSTSMGVFGIFSDNYNISGHIIRGKNITQGLKSLVLNNRNQT